MQGAWLVSKVERDLALAENFKKILFSPQFWSEAIPRGAEASPVLAANVRRQPEIQIGGELLALRTASGHHEPSGVQRTSSAVPIYRSCGSSALTISWPSYRHSGAAPLTARDAVGIRRRPRCDAAGRTARRRASAAASEVPRRGGAAVHAWAFLPRDCPASGDIPADGQEVRSPSAGSLQTPHGAARLNP
jgi:hypothetical protein